MREICPPGSVRGVLSNEHSYRDSPILLPAAVAPKAHNHRERGVSFGLPLHRDWLQFDGVAGLYEVGYLNTDERIFQVPPTKVYTITR